MVSITFPTVVMLVTLNFLVAAVVMLVTLNFLVEGELGYFRFIEACFNWVGSDAHMIHPQ
jgi:hypothetical protein